MKKSLVILILSLCLLTLFFVSCGQPPEVPPEENEYEYKFSVGAGDDVVEIAYVVETVYESSSDVTDCEVFAEVNGTRFETYSNRYQFSGKSGTVSVNNQLDLKLENGTLTPTSISGPGIIPSYALLSGTYALSENSQLDEQEGLADVDFTLTLNENGTGSFMGIALTYYPLSGDKIVIFDEESARSGLVLNLYLDSKTHEPQQNSLSYDFSVGASFADYYKVFLDPTHTTWGGQGYFTGHSLVTNGTHFYIEGQQYVTGSYELSGGIMTLRSTDSEDAAVTLAVTSDWFDFEREKSYVAGDSYIYLYKNGLSHVSHSHMSGDYEVPKGLGNSDVPAIYQREGNKTYVFDKETLDVVAVIPGDTYIDFSTYTRYADRIQQSSGDPVSHLCISSDKETIFISFPYSGNDGAIEYVNITEDPDYYARLRLNDSVVITRNQYYFLIENTYIAVDAGDYPQLGSIAASATGYSITGASVAYSTVHWDNSDVYRVPYEDVFLAKIVGDDGTVTYAAIGISNYDGVPFSYAVWESGRMLVDNVEGMTVLAGPEDMLIVVKKIGDVHEFVKYDIELLPHNLQYFETSDDYVTLKERLSDTYYLINRDTLGIDFIIEDEDYAGLAGARIINMAGVDRYDASLLDYTNLDFFGKIIVFDTGKLYRPVGSRWYLKCCEYEAVECSFPALVMDEVIKYTYIRHWMGEDSEVTVYLYVNEDGYYDLIAYSDQWMDPDGLAAFTAVDGSAKAYALSLDGDDGTLELTRYTDSAGNEYMLLVGYVLSEYHMDQSSYTMACAEIRALAFGRYTETASGYEITNIMGGAVYTVTVDGDTAGVVIGTAS